MKTTFILLLTALFFSCASKKNSINFEKITFHSSRCFGNCPILNLQVNKDKTLRLSKQEIFIRQKMSNKEGFEAEKDFEYFTGKISDTLYGELLTEIIRTDTISFKGQNCCDAPFKTITIYYNGKRKQIETMFPPQKGEKLISILYEITKSENLLRTTEKFEIE